jgi:uroporphyrinogen decarboxylase
MESSRERIKKAINHIQSEVVPVNLMGFENLEDWLKHFGVQDYYQLCKTLDVDVFPDAPPVYRGPEITPGLDIWGASYSWTGANGAGFSSDRGGYPFSSDSSIEQIENYNWPDPDDFDYSVVHPVLSKIPNDKPLWIRPLYIFPPNDIDQTESVRAQRAEWMPVLCTLFNLFGMEETLINLALKPKLIEAALEKIEHFIIGFCERMIKSSSVSAEIFWFGDDFASANGMIISPEHWRRYLKPVYRKVFALAKRHNMKVWFHSCGTFRPVMSDLIDIGMDIWETVQVHLPGNDPKELKDEYGRHITFYGGINSQKTLPFGTPEQVRAEVRERIRVLGAGGGYICSSDHTILPDVPFENVMAMVDEAKKFHF